MATRYVKWAAAGVAATVLTLGSVAGVMQARGSDQQPAAPAQQQQGDRREEFLNRLATNLGVSVDQFKSVLKQTGLQEVDQAVANGRLTADQAQKLKDAINSGKVGTLALRLGMGRGAAAANAHGAQLAAFLGISQKELHDGRQSGQSLAQVAEAHGKTRDQFKLFITDSTKQRLDALVKDGKYTQQQEDRDLARLAKRLDRMIDRTKK